MMQKFLFKLVPFLGTLYLKFTGITSRLTLVVSSDAKKFYKENKTFVYAIWHDQLAYLIYSHRNRNVSALVSKSKDGQYIAGVLKNFGFNSVRGSTSRGASTAVMALLEELEAGKRIVLTPDGPKGPRHKPQKGALYLAKKAQMPIIPVACALSCKKVFNSWDKFQLPLPFTKAAVVYGNQINVNSEEDTLLLEEELNKITAKAQSMINK